MCTTYKTIIFKGNKRTRMNDNYPSLLSRIQSIFIDTVFLLALIFLVSASLDKFENVPDWVRIFLFTTLFVLYEPVCLTFGCTLGNWIKGIRVRQYNDLDKRINLLQAFIRYLFKVLLGWISFVTIHSNDNKRAIHDLISGSVMVKVN